MDDDLASVFLLARQIFVGQIAIGIAGAPDIDAGASNAMPGEPGMDVEIAGNGAVTAAIRHHLDDNRHLGLGKRAPKSGGDARAVSQRDPQRIDGFDGKGELGSYHGRYSLNRLVERSYNKAI